MATSADNISEQLHNKIDALSPARQRDLLRLIDRLEDDAREIEDVDPRDSLRQALKEVKAGETRSIDGLWDRLGL